MYNYKRLAHNLSIKRASYQAAIFVFLVLINWTPITGQPAIIIAHRGASFDAPENTLAAINLAWNRNTDAVEIDVHLSSDKRIMVIHDKTTKRTAGKNHIVKKSSSELLRGLDVGSFKGPEYRGEKIPLLEEVISTIPEGKRLFIEVKCGTEIIPYLSTVIDNSEKRAQLSIISFDLDVVRESKIAMPQIPAYYLHYSLLGSYKSKWIDVAKQAGLDGLNFRHKGIDAKFAEAVKNEGLSLFAWTVDNPEVANRLVRIGVSGITTNRPQLLKNELKPGDNQ
jgi:glycerophosphoryl diester phosphodiesterase